MHSVKLIKNLKKYDFIAFDGKKVMFSSYSPKAGESHETFGQQGTMFFWYFGNVDSVETYDEYPVVYL